MRAGARNFGTLPPAVLRVYVAAAQEDYKRARAAMYLLRALGCEVTHDWTVEVAAHEGRPLKPEDLERYASLDMEAVRDADVVLVLSPDTKEKGCGVWAELGMAVALGKRLVITGVNRSRCIFSSFGDCHESDAEGIWAVHCV